MAMLSSGSVSFAKAAPFPEEIHVQAPVHAKSHRLVRKADLQDHEGLLTSTLYHDELGSTIVTDSIHSGLHLSGHEELIFAENMRGSRTHWYTTDASMPLGSFMRSKMTLLLDLNSLERCVQTKCSIKKSHFLMIETPTGRESGQETLNKLIIFYP